MEERTVSLADLKRVPPFRALRDETLKTLAQLGSVRVFSPRSIIYSAGEPNQRLIIVLHGEIFLRYAYGDVTTDIEVFEPGDLWGYTTLLKPSKRYPYHVATGTRAVEAIELPIAKVLTSLGKEDDRRYRFIFELSELQRKRSTERQSRVALLFTLAALLHKPAKQESLDLTLSIIIRAFSCTSGMLVSFDDHAREALVESAHDLKGIQLRDRIPFASDILIGAVYANGERVVVSPDEKHTRYQPLAYRAPIMLAEPLYEGGALTGALILTAGSDRGAVSPQEQLTVAAVAPLIACALGQRQRERERHNTVFQKRSYVAPI